MRRNVDYKADLLADLRDDNGAAVPFFGTPALSTVFPALLARKTGRPLYAGHADLAWPDAPHLVMWHALSLLREHRGAVLDLFARTRSPEALKA